MAEITLHQFAPDLGAESASPFCVKVHRALGLKGVDYKVRAVGSPGDIKRVNPERRKLPVLEVDGTYIADSTKILKYLDQKYPENPIWTDEQPWFSAMLEDWADESLYWFAVYYRWQIKVNFDAFAKRAFAKMPAPLRLFVPGLIQKQTIKQLHAQGIGRYSEGEVRQQLAGHLERLSAVLAENAWMSGKHIGAADLAVFPIVRQIALPSSPETQGLVAEQTALVAWMKAVDEKTANEHTVPVE